MSEVMEQGILRMPPKYWIKGHPIDELQRHNAYVAAADHLLELERENAALRADKARLDWFINLDEEDRVKFCRGWYRWTPEQVRAEIDEELRKEAQP
jgi:hypothetical protein